MKKLPYEKTDEEIATAADAHYQQWKTEGLFVWAVSGWLCRKSCCAGKAAV
jgi:hypothetical protein